MSRGRFHPAAFFSAGDADRSPGWRLNGVPVNLRTGLLAAVLLVAIMSAAGIGYRLFAEGTTDMTLPAVPSPIDATAGEKMSPLGSG